MIYEKLFISLYYSKMNIMRSWFKFMLQKNFVKLNFSPVLFEKNPANICLVLVLKWKWMDFKSVKLQFRLNNFVFPIFNEKKYFANWPTHVIIPTSGCGKQTRDAKGLKFKWLWHKVVYVKAMV